MATKLVLLFDGHCKTLSLFDALDKSIPIVTNYYELVYPSLDIQIHVHFWDRKTRVVDWIVVPATKEGIAQANEEWQEKCKKLSEKNSRKRSSLFQCFRPRKMSVRVNDLRLVLDELIRVTEKADTNHETVVIWWTDRSPFCSESLSSLDWMALCKRAKQCQLVFYPVIVNGSLQTPLLRLYLAALAAVTTGQLWEWFSTAETNQLQDSLEKMIIQVCLSMNRFFPLCDHLLIHIYNPVGNLKWNEKRLLEEKELKREESATFATFQRCLTRPSMQEKEIIQMYEKNNHRPDWIQQKMTCFVELLEKVVSDENFLKLFQQQDDLSLVWRALCSFRNHPGRSELLSVMQRVTLSSPAIKTWIEQSYDQSRNMTKILQRITPRYPALYLKDPLNRSLFLDWIRKCSASAQKSISLKLRALKTVEEGTLSQTVLPLSLSDMDLFRYLPHLLSPGTRGSLFTSILLASMCIILDHAVLKPRAMSFLQQKHFWIDWKQPESYAAGFFSLILKCDEIVTTETGTGLLSLSDRQRVQFAMLVKGFLANGSMNLMVKVPAASLAIVVRRDDKNQCQKCYKWRSLSFMKGDECVICQVDDTFCRDPLTSRMLACSQCQVHYAVLHSVHRKGRPYCFYCRNGFNDSSVVRVQCHKCSFLFFSSTKVDSYTCAQCRTQPSATALAEVSVEMKNLFKENRQLFLDCIGFVDDGTWENPPFQSSSLSLLTTLPVQLKEPLNLSQLYRQLTWHEWPVHNTKIVLEAWLKSVQSGLSFRYPCSVCFEPFSKKYLYSFCARKGCHASSCLECLRNWYGDNKLGAMIQVRQLHCAFCCRIPSPGLFRRFNPAVLALLPHVKELNGNNVYYWCLLCQRPKAEGTLACGDAAYRNNGEDFVCDECKDANRSGVVKACPQCHVLTERLDGCGHVHCTQCGTHWCFVCGFQGDEENIYRHLEMHPNYGIGMDYDGNEYEL